MPVASRSDAIPASRHRRDAVGSRPWRTDGENENGVPEGKEPTDHHEGSDEGEAGRSCTSDEGLLAGEGYPLLCSVSIVDGCERAIDWYTKVLGGKERMRLDMPGGGVGHSEIGFGGAVLMLASPMPRAIPRRRRA